MVDQGVFFNNSTGFRNRHRQTTVEELSPMKSLQHRGEITQDQLMTACVNERQYQNKEYLQLSVEQHQEQFTRPLFDYSGSCRQRLEGTENKGATDFMKKQDSGDHLMASIEHSSD